MVEHSCPGEEEEVEEEEEDPCSSHNNTEVIAFISQYKVKYRVPCRYFYLYIYAEQHHIYMYI